MVLVTFKTLSYLSVILGCAVKFCTSLAVLFINMVDNSLKIIWLWLTWITLLIWQTSILTPSERCSVLGVCRWCRRFLRIDGESNKQTCMKKINGLINNYTTGKCIYQRDKFEKKTPQPSLHVGHVRYMSTMFATCRPCMFTNHHSKMKSKNPIECFHI